MATPDSVGFMLSPSAVGFMSTGLTSTIEGYWKFENDYTDSSKNSYTLTPTGSPTFVSGGSQLVDDYSLDLEYSSGQFATIANASLDENFPCASAGTVRSFTVLLHIKPESMPSLAYLVSKYNTASERSFAVKFAATTGYVGVNHGHTSGTAYEYVDFTTGCSVGTEYGVAYSYNDSTKAYRLSVYDYTAGDYLASDVTGNWTNNISITEADFVIGNRDGGASYFDGIIDEVVVVAEVLTTAKIAEYFAETYPD